MKNFKTDTLEIQLETSGNLVTMLWLGESRALNPACDLEPYFFGLVKQLKQKQLHIDFTGLKYMNSSTVLPILFFIRHLEENSIPTQIIYKKNSNWQETYFIVIDEVINDYENVDIIVK